MNARYGRSHTSRIKPMCFRKLPSAPVVLGEPSRPTFDRQSEGFQPSEEFPTGCIYSCSITQRCFHSLQSELQAPGLSHEVPDPVCVPCCGYLADHSGYAAAVLVVLSHLAGLAVAPRVGLLVQVAL